MTLYFVQLCERSGQPWGTPRVVQADSPEDAARQAFPTPPSSLHVKHAWVAALAEPYSPTQVEIDVPAPKWGRARPANPQAREPQREVDGHVVRRMEDPDPSLYDDAELDARAERVRENAL